MRAGAFLIPLLLTGCSPALNTFEVSAPRNASASLRLCGRDTDLERLGGRLVALRAINCEGDGSIVVRAANRPPVICIVGYVTPGAVQSFRFRIDGDRCVAAS